jgi:Spy/CpxP family protein refolding chaperone
MKPMVRLVAGAFVLTLVTAALGSWIGVQYGLQQVRSSPGLDGILHHELGLSAEQNARIAALEAQFAQQRKALEEQMRAANRDLAAALEAEHAYGERAAMAIKQFHNTMAVLQEATIKHVLAMREVLTPEQTRRFDETVSEALLSDRP